MDSASNMSVGNRRSGKSRRTWSVREEEVLVGALKELVANGWKSDNGFRVGYLHKLEDAMKEVFPGTDLKGQPHINSKITTWKKFYGSLSSMLRQTGVNFNGTTFMIDFPNEELWDAIVREDNNAAAMRFKSWPLYESWIEVFGKDRATGEGAEDVMDAINELTLEDNLAQTRRAVETDYHLNFDDLFDKNQSEGGTSVNQSGKEVDGPGKKPPEKSASPSTKSRGCTILWRSCASQPPIAFKTLSITSAMSTGWVSLGSRSLSSLEPFTISRSTKSWMLRRSLLQMPIYWRCSLGSLLMLGLDTSAVSWGTKGFDRKSCGNAADYLGNLLGILLINH